MASEVDVEALARELNRWPWCDAMCASGDVACGVCQQQHTMLALLARLREAERALAIVKESEAESYAAYTRAAVERDEARSALAAEHATALEALRQAEAAEARVAELQATAVAPEPEAKDAATLAFDAIARAVGCPEWDYPGQLVRDVERLRKERDEARAALAKMEEEHRAAVEALEMYESRIGDIADHVLGLVPPDVPSVVKLDAIERRCGEERVAARQAEARVAELTATLTEINAIRNSIVGAQTVNWSEHVYPLVAALDAAGFAGMPYPEARENVGTLIERANQAEARVAELEAMRDVLGSTVQQADGVIIRGSERIAVLEHIADAAAAYREERSASARANLFGALAARGKDGG